jgi:hypothetical protein
MELREMEIKTLDITTKLQKIQKRTMLNETQNVDQAWWYMPLIPALRKAEKEDLKFKAQPGLHRDPVSKTTTTTNRMWECLSKKMTWFLLFLNIQLTKKGGGRETVRQTHTHTHTHTHTKT